MALTVNPQTHKAVKLVNNAVTGWKNSLNEFGQFIDRYTEEKLMELSEQEAALTEKIATLEAEYSEKRRVFKVDHELAIKASKKDAVETLADDLGYILLTEEEHDVLADKANRNANETAKEIAVAKATIERTYKQQMKEAELQSRVDQAETNAKLTTQEQTIANMRQEIERLSNLLEKANNSIVEVAQANTATVNVESKR